MTTTHSPSPIGVSLKNTKQNKKICHCGASGCMVYPALSCKTDTCKGDMCLKPVATKVFFDENNYDKETRIFDSNNKLLLELDKDEKYFLSSYQPCGVVKEKELELYNCPYPEEKKVKTKKGGPTTKTQAVSVAPINENFAWNYSSSEETDSFEESPLTNKSFKAINFSYLGTDMEQKIKDLKEITKDNIQFFLFAVENIFKGLKKLNDAGIYHCDIKPQNIVLDDRDGKFKIIDFGLAIFEKELSSMQIHSDAYIKSNKSEFTTGYISPEFYFSKYEGFGHGLGISALHNNAKARTIEFKLMFYEAKNTPTLKPTKTQTMSYAYYDALNMCPHLTYYKNDIWSLGYVLIAIRLKFTNLIQITNEYNKKHTKTQKDDFDYLNMMNEFEKVIEALLVLNIKERPDATQALRIYRDFLEKVFGLSYAGGKRKRKSRKLHRLKKKNKSRRLYH